MAGILMRFARGVQSGATPALFAHGRRGGEAAQACWMAPEGH
jgi:hypothetical protein